MRFLFIIQFSIFISCFAQNQEKGVIIDLNNSTNSVKGESYALIMGISNYKNESIPQLNYADDDAIAFENYLIQSGVKIENIFTLINENATNSAFWTQLNLISEKTKQGDIVYIYFSGHGDVETKTVVKDAYLLPYDSPSSVYPMGAIGITYLKSWLATFAANGVQTVFIADACRSGNLIGGREGMEAAANILKETWKEEIKMVSCQPGELSLEGEQWGGGRGLFSYELINGLSGEADKNKDFQISLRELKLYLMEKVPDHAGKNSQNPEISGNNEKIISRYTAEILAKNEIGYVQKKNNSSDNFSTNQISNKVEEKKENSNFAIRSNLNTLELNAFSKIENKDTASIRHYKNCIYLIQQNKLVSENEPSAYASYLKISDNVKELKQLAKSELTDRMLQHVQLLIQIIITNSLSERNDINLTQTSFEAMALRILLGDKKIKEMGIFPQILFAESCLTFSAGRSSKWTMPSDLGLAKLDSALQFEPGAVYIHVLKGVIYRYQLNKPDLALKSLRYAIQINPNFDLAQELFTNELIDLNQYDSLLYYSKNIRPSLLRDSRFYVAYKKLNLNDSIKVYQTKLIGHCYKPWDKKAEYRNSKLIADVLLRAKEAEMARSFFFQSVKTLEEIHFNDADYIDVFLHDINYLYYQIACTYALENKLNEAIEYIEKAIDAGYIDLEWMLKDPDLISIQKSNKFKKLIQKKQKEARKSIQLD